jgi:hypothetical protein
LILSDKGIGCSREIRGRHGNAPARQRQGLPRSRKPGSGLS